MKEQHVKEKVKLDQTFLEMNCPKIILLYQKEQLRKNVVLRLTLEVLRCFHAGVDWFYAAEGSPWRFAPESGYVLRSLRKKGSQSAHRA